MATVYKTWPNDQHWSWSTGISLGTNEYISSVSISGPGFQDNTMDGCTLYFGGVQIAVVSAGYVGTVSGYASGKITSTGITCNRGEFSWRGQVTITYTVASSAVSRTISKTNSPSAGGSFTTKVNGSNVTSATKNTTVAVAATASSGYVFKSWTTSPASLISASTTASTSFTMPDQNVTITANWYKLSTGTLSTKSITGGGTVTLTITAQSSSYKHYYNLSFGSGMATGDVLVNAGTTSVTISVPMNWSAQIPNATSKSGGTLTLKTYDGSKNVGSTTITGITYNVPASVKPSMGTITPSIVRTIDNVTYADIGEIYAQNHCGVRVQASASGQQSATITSLSVKIGNYSGNKYNKTVTTGSVDFTSGLLGTSGTNTITVTATDSRGRTNSASVNITVEAYAKPSGSLRVWRVDSNGDPDDMGDYGKYELTKTYSQIGNNSMTWTLTAAGNSASSPGDTDDLLPNNRLEFSETSEYTVTLTLTDGLETTVITATLPSARFVMAFDSTGNKIGIMRFPNKTIPTGKERTLEISDETQIYYGNTPVDLEYGQENLTLETGFTANEAYVTKYGKIAIITVNTLTAASTGSSWVKVTDLPTGIVPKAMQYGYFSNDTDYDALTGGPMFQVRMLTTGSMEVYKPQSGKKMWGSVTFICE